MKRPVYNLLTWAPAVRKVIVVVPNNLPLFNEILAL